MIYLQVLTILVLFLYVHGNATNKRRYVLNSTSNSIPQEEENIISRNGNVLHAYECAILGYKYEARAFTFSSENKKCVTYNKTLNTSRDIDLKDKFHHFNMCPKGSYQFLHVCYYISQEKKPWTSAAAHCENMGGYLADMKSREEQSSMNTFLSDVKEDLVWIGGNDYQKEGEFVWLHDDSKFSESLEWESGEPNNWYGQECTALYHVDKTVWLINDKWCGDKMLFMCKF